MVGITIGLRRRQKAGAQVSQKRRVTHVQAKVGPAPVEQRLPRHPAVLFGNTLLCHGQEVFGELHCFDLPSSPTSSNPALMQARKAARTVGTKFR